MPPIIIAIQQFVPSFFAAACSAKATFFFIPAWYEYLKVAQDTTGACAVQNFKFPDDLLPVGLAVVDMLVRLGGFVAIVSIIIAGVTYMSSGGDAQKAASARKRIYNSLIGLVIVFVAAGVIAFIGNSLGG